MTHVSLHSFSRWWRPFPCFLSAIFPNPLCIKSPRAPSSFLIYLKIQRVLLTSSILVAWGVCRPATNRPNQPATRFNPATQFHYHLICRVRWWWQSCEATLLMVHFTAGRRAGGAAGTTSGETERCCGGQSEAQGKQLNTATTQHRRSCGATFFFFFFLTEDWL